MEGLLLHLFLVSPCINWLMSRERVYNRRSLFWGYVLAVCLLLGLASYQLRRKNANHYETLGIPVHASRSQIQSAYRKLAIQLHPDKTTESDAAGKFEAVLKAQEILTNETKKKAYLRFGDLDPNYTEADYLEIVILSFFHLVIPLFCGLLYTFGNGSDAREVFVGYCAFAFVCELLLRFEPNVGCFGYIPIFGGFLPFEQISFLQGLTSVVLNAVLLLSNKETLKVDHIALSLASSSLARVMALDKCVSLISKAAKHKDAFLRITDLPPLTQQEADIFNNLFQHHQSLMSPQLCTPEYAGEWRKGGVRERGGKGEGIKMMENNAKIDKKQKIIAENKSIPLESMQNYPILPESLLNALPLQPGPQLSPEQIESARDLAWASTQGAKMRQYIITRIKQKSGGYGSIISSILFLTILGIQFYL